MQIFEYNKITREAKEGDVVKITIPVTNGLSPKEIEKSCGCSNVEMFDDKYIVTIRSLLSVRYMSNSDHYFKNVYIKAIHKDGSEERVDIQIKVTKK